MDGLGVGLQSVITCPNVEKPAKPVGIAGSFGSFFLDARLSWLFFAAGQSVS